MKTGKLALGVYCAVCVFASGGLLFAETSGNIFPGIPDEAILYYDDGLVNVVSAVPEEKQKEPIGGEKVSENDVPYLTDEDEESVQVVLPEDTPENPSQPQQTTEPPKNRREAQHLYHLLVLDRVDCPSADVDVAHLSITVLYTFKHGTDGYLIMLYRTAADNPRLPNLPDDSRITLYISAARPSTLKDFVNSGVFRRYVTHRTVIAELLKLL